VATHRDIASRRTLALVGPSAAGKTSLAEALLWKAGAVGAPGSVEKGSTVSDYDPLEKRGLRSLNTTLLHFEHRGITTHLVDTPGAPDFLGQSLPALEAVETAAVVINAGAGIEPMAVRMMEWAQQRERDRIIIVNKIDAQGVDLQALVAQIQAAFGKECLPLNLPSQKGERVLDCFWKMKDDGPPPDFSSVEQAHRALVEQVVEGGRGLRRALPETTVTSTRRSCTRRWNRRCAKATWCPICFVSARTGAGVPELLDVIERLLPDPPRATRRPSWKARAKARSRSRRSRSRQARAGPRVQDHAGPLRRQDGRDARAPGHDHRDSQLYVGDGRRPFKVGHLFMLQGKELKEVAKAVPGDLCADRQGGGTALTTRCCMTRPRMRTST
jgi:elongation factor G